MRAGDLARFAAASLIRSPGRTFLMLLAMSIGVSAVVVLTGLGEGARRYITGEFASLGTNLVIVIPGRSETTGGAPAIMAGETPRDLTIEDYLALTRNPLVKQAAPVMVGAAGAAYGRLEREITVVGTTSEYMKIRHMAVDRGKFLPPGDPSRAVNVCVIGKKIRQELFGNEQALGEWLRLGDRRFRVIGILGSSGRSLGVDLQELVIIPVASAQALFNSPGLFRILVEARSRDSMPRLQDQIRKTVARRHQGEEDITVVTQDAVLATFDNILRALTFTVGGYWGDQSRRGRHSDHEHHAGCRQPACPGNRTAQSGGCQERTAYPDISQRSGDAGVAGRCVRSFARLPGNLGYSWRLPRPGRPGAGLGDRGRPGRFITDWPGVWHHAGPAGGGNGSCRGAQGMKRVVDNFRRTV